MSHNAYKIGTVEPNAQSVLSARVEDMQNVSTSGLATNDLLTYDSSTQTWTNEAPSSNANAIMIGRGESDSYSNLGISIAVGNIIGFYDSNALNSISGATINYTSGTSWVQSVTLPSGTYYITAQTVFVFSASGYMSFRCTSTGGTIYSSLAVIGTNLAAYGGAGTTLQGVAVLTSTTTLNIVAVALSNVSTASNQGNIPSESGVLFIRKVA